MGMFTSVFLEDGTEIQFKAGGDDCDQYKVGDTVNWWVDKDHVGSCGLLDGIYAGCSGEIRDNVNTLKQWWVCIKDHVIVAVAEAFPHDGWPDDAPPQYRGHPGHICQREMLYDKHQIPREHPRELWTEAAWRQHDESKAISEEDFKRHAAKYADDPESRAACAVNYYTQTQMRQPSTLRQIFKVGPETEEVVREDKTVLWLGMKGKRFDRDVTIKRFYPHEKMMSVEYEHGTLRCVPYDEFTPEVEATRVTV